MSLRDVSYEGGEVTFPTRRRTGDDAELAGYLEEAARIVERMEAAPGHGHCSGPEVGTEDFESLRWFPLPSEAAARLAASAG